MQKTAIIVGAGPAGLTAAYELLTRTDIKPVVLEQSDEIGGLSRTVVYKGNRMDIGGHRFFSKSDRVMEWWLKMMPLEAGIAGEQILRYQNSQTALRTETPSPPTGDPDKVMLLRRRRSRIYFLKKFFPYPLSLSLDTLRKLGLFRTLRILFSYLRVKIMPPAQLATLEDFFIARFGRELYKTFFKTYTEKVWGVPCSSLPASWGAQRIKNLSIRQAVKHMVQQANPLKKDRTGDISQKDVSTSLIEQFLYPRFGPGQMWETVADKIIELGGSIVKNTGVSGWICSGNKVEAVVATNHATGEQATYAGEIFFSTMPLKDLVKGINGIEVPEAVAAVADGLQYRDFITIGLLVKEFSAQAVKQGPLTDNWIYIQDEGIQLGRLQIFNNWSPAMVANPGQQWLGLEYFCNKGDYLWNLPDPELVDLAKKELAKIGLVDDDAVIDANIIRQEKTYPSYTGAYQHFDLLKNYLLQFENLFPIGRNGMHRYNNSDHSMLTAMTSVDQIVEGMNNKMEIWNVNTEDAYHEEK